VDVDKVNEIVASREDLLAVVAGGSAQDAAQRCYETYGSGLCADLASARAYVEKALGNVDFWKMHYIVLGGRVLVVEGTLGGYVRVTSKQLDELLKGYWPLCTQNHSWPIVHGEDYWYFGQSVHRVSELDSFMRAMSALREWLMATPEVAAEETRRAALGAVDSLLAKAQELKEEYSHKNRAGIRI